MNNQQANESVKAAIIERWRQSSPWEQGRLDILKEAVAHGVEERLYDTEEQQKYGLENDEFLVLACRYGMAMTGALWIRFFYIPYIIIALINIAFVCPYVESISSRHFYGIWLDISCVAILIAALIAIIIYRRTKYLLLTNRTIHFGRKIDRLDIISLNRLLIKNNIDKSSLTRSNFLLDILIFKDSQLMISICKYKKSNNFQNAYILYALSYLSRQYNHCLYVFPLRCGFTCDRKDYVYSELNIFIGGIFDIFYLMKQFRRNIEFNFSDRQDIEAYLTCQKIAGCNNNTTISMLRNGTDSDGELFWVPAIKKADGITYKIHVAAKEVWLESNGLKTSDIVPLTDIEIYHSHKYFIFLFPNNKKYIAYYVWKKSLFFPFLDIMEIILKEKIAYMGSGYVVWES